MNLEEGWVKYSYNQALNVKGGLILPSFNALLKVKNRTPLLPYILRPLVYEPLMADRMNTEAFLPFRANVEVYGSIPVYDLNVDYAVFWGNSESSYIISGHGTGLPGVGHGYDTLQTLGRPTRCVHTLDACRCLRDDRQGEPEPDGPRCGRNATVTGLT